MAEKLTAKQAKFVEEYLVDLNATQAAIRAGYSKDTAAVIASQNLSKLNIQQAISEKQRELSDKTGVTIERVLQELATIGFSNLLDYSFDDYGHVNLAAGANEDAVRAVSKIKRKKIYDDDGNEIGQETEITLWDKVAALEKLGRHLGMFKNDVPAGGGTVNNFIKVEFVSANNSDTGSVQRVIPSKEI